VPGSDNTSRVNPSTVDFPVGQWTTTVIPAPIDSNGIAGSRANLGGPVDLERIALESGWATTVEDANGNVIAAWTPADPVVFDDGTRGVYSASTPQADGSIWGSLEVRNAQGQLTYVFENDAAGASTRAIDVGNTEVWAEQTQSWDNAGRQTGEVFDYGNMVDTYVATHNLTAAQIGGMSAGEAENFVAALEREIYSGDQTNNSSTSQPQISCSEVGRVGCRLLRPPDGDGCKTDHDSGRQRAA
jgi:hypothetical protein